MNLSTVLNIILSKSIWRLLLLYIILSLVIICIYSLLYYLNRNGLQYNNQNFIDYIFFSISVYGTLGYFYFIPNSIIIKSFILLESFSAVLVNGSLVSIFVYKLLRIQGENLIFTKYIVFSKSHNCNKRLEFRIYNNSNFDIINLKFKLRMNHILKTFPNTNFQVMYDVKLKREEYIYLTKKNYFVIITAENEKPSADRELVISEDFLEKFEIFELLLLVEGEYLNTGLKYSQFKTYHKNDIIGGKWKYLKKDELEFKNEKLNIKHFNEIEYYE